MVGKWIVTPQYVLESNKARVWLDEASFEWGAPPTGCPPDCGCRQGHAGCSTAMATLDRSRGRRRLCFLASGRLRRQLQEKGGLQKVQSDVIHGLSQQGIWVSFWTPKPLKTNPQDTQFFCEEFLKMSISSI